MFAQQLTLFVKLMLVLESSIQHLPKEQLCCIG